MSDIYPVSLEGRQISEIQRAALDLPGALIEKLPPTALSRAFFMARTVNEWNELRTCARQKKIQKYSPKMQAAYLTLLLSGMPEEKARAVIAQEAGR